MLTVMEGLPAGPRALAVQEDRLAADLLMACMLSRSSDPSNSHEGTLIRADQRFACRGCNLVLHLARRTEQKLIEDLSGSARPPELTCRTSTATQELR